MSYDLNVYSLFLDPRRNQVVFKKGEDTAMRSLDKVKEEVISRRVATVVQKMALVEKEEEIEGVVEKVIEMVAKVEDHKIEKIRR